MEIEQWCERVFEFWVEKDLKKEGVFLFFWVAERQREKSKERGVTRIVDLSLLGVNFLCIGLNKRLGLKLLHTMQYPRYCTGCESVVPLSHTWDLGMLNQVWVGYTHPKH